MDRREDYDRKRKRQVRARRTTTKDQATNQLKLQLQQLFCKNILSISIMSGKGSLSDSSSPSIKSQMFKRLNNVQFQHCCTLHSTWPIVFSKNYISHDPLPIATSSKLSQRDDKLYYATALTLTELFLKCFILSKNWVRKRRNSNSFHHLLLLFMAWRI